MSAFIAACSCRSASARAQRAGLTALSLAAALALAPRSTAAQAAEPAASAASAAIQQLRPGWQVLHCGVARGILYVTYADRGQAAISPAAPNPAIVKACAAAGYPVAASAAQRGGLAAAQPAPGSSTAARPAPAPAANRSQPTFTPMSLGSSLSIEARNDSDIAWQCSINFSWTSDEAGGIPRSATTQATLPPRQNNRVAGVSGAYRNMRFVGSPSWFCNPAE